MAKFIKGKCIGRTRSRVKEDIEIVRVAILDDSEVEHIDMINPAEDEIPKVNSIVEMPFFIKTYKTKDGAIRYSLSFATKSESKFQPF
ncbi:MAG: hypothetical protein K9I71_08610 [Ignavibacteriales bacterium]|nr:hypothetical protein [Ignavibacteriales bacterium]MCF8316173.1 hypothetical protein [Ignavibacteriales bacterium]MCF8436675.1 hypothetical protein [Ignavibacteriales bacterium]